MDTAEESPPPTSDSVQLVPPTIRDDECFAEISKKLALYIIQAIDSPLSWDDLRSSKHLKTLQPLIDKLVDDVHHQAIVAALVALKGHFTAMESDDDCGINESRGYACELVAWQFVMTLSDHELLDYLLFELHDEEYHNSDTDDEETALLVGNRCNGYVNANGQANGQANGNGAYQISHSDGHEHKHNSNEGFAEPFINLNTLEMAAVSGAKKFLSQRTVQDVIGGIWSGDIVFWNTLSSKAVKKARYYDKKTGDAWSRLRVPRYMKVFEITFFLSFLALFYVVSLQREFYRVTPWEVLFYVFLVGFFFEEVEEFLESGVHFYSTDIWALWDVGIVVIGVAFFVLRVVGLVTGNDTTLEVAFSILALHSLLLMPRVCSCLTLNQYYGSLVPALKEMGKQFIRFTGFTLVIYFGFFSTFILLARGHFPLDDLSIIVLKAFFGAGVAGFDVASKVSPYLGLPVMIIFVCLTNQLLITSMMAHISNSLRMVLDSAREEYLYVYSVYVLEASTSDKLTYFQPPFNLVPILIFRPILFVLPHQAAVKLRIFLLKATHAPFVVMIWAYEQWRDFIARREAAERSALSFRFGNMGSMVTWYGAKGDATPTLTNKKKKSSAALSNRKHTLQAGRSKFQVPASLLLHASRRPGHMRGSSSRQPGSPMNGYRSNTAPAATTSAASRALGDVPSPAASQVKLAALVSPAKGALQENGAPAPGRQPRAATAPVTTTASMAAPATEIPADAMQAEMMRMLKELSTQIEEVRAALVRHDQGPGVGE
ncbi:hypothetical protein BX600DRAFT_514116 [Xylariales sp. PMI_506]|nr:hypothetical protein BX600DRAFT_514116 [Xylariales sp. PMI_506]